MQISSEDIDNWFTYHAPDERQVAVYRRLRNAGGRVADLFNATVPDGVEKDNAMQALRQAIMWANAGIACGAPLVSASRTD